MVKMQRTFNAFAVLAVLLLMSQVAAADTVINFTDTVKYWPGYGNGTGDDNLDTIGEPNITGGSLIIDSNGYLKQVLFDFINPPGWEFEKMKPGDLFLDLGANGSWDYVVSSYNGRDNTDLDNKYIPTGDVGLYSTSGGSLLTTGPDNQGYWRGYLLRNNHPFAYTDLAAGNRIGDASISGGYLNDSPVIFTLPNEALWLGGNLTIGFTENCANDVVLATVEVPVPEPSTILLLSLGLVCGFITLKKKA